MPAAGMRTSSPSTPVTGMVSRSTSARPRSQARVRSSVPPAAVGFRLCGCRWAGVVSGWRVGEVLVTVVTLLNPGVLMIAGELSRVPFLTGVRELLYQRAMPRATANHQVVTSRLGDHSGLIGAAAMVVESLCSPTRADARLAR